MHYIDTHAHLYREEFPENLEATIQRALDAHVKQIILPCVKSTTVPFITEAVNLFPDHIFAAIGLHPEEAKENFEEELTQLEKHLDDTNVIGVGEIGLDYYWDCTYAKEQKEAFYQQLCWARDRHLPLTLHIRNAYADAIEILKCFKPGELSGVMHCFSGGIQEASWAVKHGFCIGVGGIVTFKNSKLPELLTQIGIEHIVLETDAPYLTPVPHRGTPNESAYIPLIAQKIADIFHLSEKEVCQQTTANAQRIFNKLPKII